MATIKFILQSKSNSSQIYLRLSLSKDKSYKRKTGLTINSKDWSTSTGFPKSNNPTNKNLTVDLKNLESFVLENLNISFSKKLEIDSKWLLDTISKFFGVEKTSTNDDLIPYTEIFIESLKNITSSSGKRGVSEATIKKRKTILAKLKKYEKLNKLKLKVKDVDLKFRDKFINFLEVDEKLSENTIGKYLKEVKTICLDAQKNGVEVSSNLSHFKGFSGETFKTILTFGELDKIWNTHFEDENLLATRDWLIIGCYTGQRVSDLLRMNSKMIKNVKGYRFIELIQIKTSKLVQIPIHKKVEQILSLRSGEFPKVFSKNKSSNATFFNRYLKKICEISGITNLEKGRLYDNKSERYEEGMYPKFKLVSSHICRRSFASNFYAEEKYPTPLLMNVTGHSTEKMFLSYIGKKPIDYSLKLAQIWST